MPDHDQRILLQARVRTILALPVLLGALFLTAGDLTWTAGWIYSAILILSVTLPLYGPLQFDIGLIEERLKRRKDIEPWDKAFVALIGLCSVAEMAIPGLDYRLHWSCPAPGWLMWFGAAGVALGTAGLTWAMQTNRFFSAYVRIQRDRQHHVITQGPYAFVRHPGYATWMVQGLSLPLLFGSWWTYVPVGLISLVFIVRTRLEDAMLHEKLEGYREYANRVRYRLLPGVW
jgi:protein-S-isoprenylcysteine O-methyltransferase Ste14